MWSLMEHAGGRRKDGLVRLLSSRAALKVWSWGPVRKAAPGVPPGLTEPEAGVRPSRLCLHSSLRDAPPPQSEGGR